MSKKADFEIMESSVFTVKDGFEELGRRKCKMPPSGGYMVTDPGLKGLATENAELRAKVIRLTARLVEYERLEHWKHRIEQLERHLKKAELEIVALRKERDLARGELALLQCAINCWRTR